MFQMHHSAKINAKLQHPPPKKKPETKPQVQCASPCLAKCGVVSGVTVTQLSEAGDVASKVFFISQKEKRGEEDIYIIF